MTDMTRIAPSLINRRLKTLPNVFLRGESGVEEVGEPQDAVVARAETRARVRQRRNGSRQLRGTDRQFAEALHREADGLHYKGDYETALVLYHRAASICPRDSSHGVAARRTAAAINALSNPSKTLNGLLPKVRNGGQESAVVCPESAAIRASRILNESSDPVSVVPEILGFFDKRTDFWRISKSPRVSSIRIKEKRSTAASLTCIARMETALSAGDSFAVLRIGDEILPSLNRNSKVKEPNHLETTIHRLIALAHVALGRHDRAAASASRMTRAAFIANVPLLMTQALVTLGKVHLSFGHLTAAARAWEILVPCISEPVPRAWLFHEIGRCHLESGDKRRALELARKCLNTAIEAGSEKWIFHGQLLLGQALAELGRLAEAAITLRELVFAGEEAGDARTIAYVRELAERVAQASNCETLRVGESCDVKTEEAAHLDENFIGKYSSGSSTTRESFNEDSDWDLREGGEFETSEPILESTAVNSLYSSRSTSSLQTTDSLRTLKFEAVTATGGHGDPGDQDCGSLGPSRNSRESIWTGRTYGVPSPHRQRQPLEVGISPTPKLSISAASLTP